MSKVSGFPTQEVEVHAQTSMAAQKGQLQEDVNIVSCKKSIFDLDQNDKQALGQDYVLNDSDPLNFSKRRKWTITVVTCTFTLLASASATAYTMGYPSMMRDLGCTQAQAVIGLTTFLLAFGVTPLLTSAFSEEFGRQPLYYASVAIFLAMHAAIARAPNFKIIAIARLIQGAAGSTGATMVAGTIADIWETKERGIPMALYSIFAFGGNAMGAISAGWIESNQHLEWRWIQWIWLMIGGGYAVMFVFTMRETRASVLYSLSLKKQILKGNSNKAVPKVDLRKLLRISCTRPLILLSTEPIVLTMSCFLAFAWGVLFCVISSIPQIFQSLYGFSSGQIGTVYVSMLIGVFFGYITAIYQERIYSKSFVRRSVEARLHTCCVAGLGLPISMFMFAWLCQPEVPWEFPCLALIIFYWSTYTFYLAIFSYLADCYTTHASSALAGQSMLRNTMGGLFPLFTGKIFEKLGYSWGNTLFACLAVAAAPIPFVIFFLGSRIRGRSERCIHD